MPGKLTPTERTEDSLSGRELKSPEVFDEEKAIEEIKALKDEGFIKVKPVGT